MGNHYRNKSQRSTARPRSRVACRSRGSSAVSAQTRYDGKGPSLYNHRPARPQSANKPRFKEPSLGDARFGQLPKPRGKRWSGHSEIHQVAYITNHRRMLGHRIKCENNNYAEVSKSDPDDPALIHIQKQLLNQSMIFGTSATSI